MKKNGICKWMLRSLLAVMVLCAAVMVSPAESRTTQAAETIKFSDDSEWVVAPTEELNRSYQLITIDGLEDGMKIENVKSSNKKVATVEKSTYGLWIDHGNKTGTTTISCTVNGVPLSHTFKVQYICPASKFTVDGKSVLSHLKKKNTYTVKKPIKKKKVAIKAKKGWVITKVALSQKEKYKSKNIKNKTSYSTKLTTTYPYDGICVTFQSKKTGMEQTMTYQVGYYGRYSAAAG